MNNIFVDLEIIAATNEKSLKSAIARVEPRASSEYFENINMLIANNIITDDEFRVLSDEFSDLKDRVLEEIEPKYKNVINFKEIYEINDKNKVIYDYINKFSSANLGFNFYIVFYYNTIREYNEKKEVCARYFPNCEVIAIKFYQTNYQKGYFRKRTNKAEYIKNTLGLKDLSGCILIDKSASSCDEWEELNGVSQLQLNSNSIAAHSKVNQLSK